MLRQAAVAAILREPRHGELEVLLIKRANREGDRWSGHMAFPGGRVDPTDTSALAAAMRETREEIDLDLEAHGERLGALSDLMAKARGRIVPMVIHPYVFRLDGTPELRPNEEVQEVVWVPMSLFLDPAARSSFVYTFAAVDLALPCYDFGGRRIWGLTLQMLDELVEVVRSAVPAIGAVD